MLALLSAFARGVVLRGVALKMIRNSLGDDCNT
jgi:hypothetical protein